MEYGSLSLPALVATGRAAQLDGQQCLSSWAALPCGCLYRHGRSGAWAAVSLVRWVACVIVAQAGILMPSVVAAVLQVPSAVALEQGLLGPASPIPTQCLLLKNMFNPAE